VTALSFAGLLAHGLVIWENWPREVAALLVAAVMLWLCVDLVRRGAFAPTLHVGLHRLPGDGARRHRARGAVLRVDTRAPGGVNARPPSRRIGTSFATTRAHPHADPRSRTILAGDFRVQPLSSSALLD